MSNTRVVLCAVAFLVCQAAGQLLTGDVYVAEQNQYDLNRPVTWDAQLPAALDPYGCTRPGGLPLALDPLRRCSTYVKGARLPIAVDLLGCSRPGVVPIEEDPLRLCTTYLNGSPYPIGIDRTGLMGRLGANGAYVGTGVAVNQPGTLTPTPQLPQLTPIGGSTGALPSMPGLPGASLPSNPSLPSSSSLPSV